MAEFDVCVIGGGPAGYAAAMRAWDYGRSVCLIERGQLGGASSNSSAPAVYRLYSGWEITPILRAGTVSAGKDRSAVRELLLTRQPLTA